ncbi:MAG: hypothetical protein IT494_05790 [Gammaproteobacteria bacterium]|nr:hypothetical protein [Gammaproteobacteria bacterium]
MARTTVGRPLAAILLLGVWIGALAQPGKSHKEPAPIGTAVVSIVEIGSVNSSNYDVTITVLESLRGAKALERLRTADAALAPAPAGHEYLLARVRFELRGRAVSDRGSFQVGTTPAEWLAHSATLVPYASINVSVPQPPLQGMVRAGTTLEGWLAFAVETKEPHPVLIFDPSGGGGMGRGNLLFFSL